jgi:hypothetical protein
MQRFGRWPMCAIASGSPHSQQPCLLCVCMPLEGLRCFCFCFCLFVCLFRVLSSLVLLLLFCFCGCGALLLQLLEADSQHNGQRYGPASLLKQLIDM